MKRTTEHLLVLQKETLLIAVIGDYFYAFSKHDEKISAECGKIPPCMEVVISHSYFYSAIEHNKEIFTAILCAMDDKSDAQEINNLWKQTDPSQCFLLI